MHYKHHVIPLHEWRKRINSKATRYDREFNSPDNVVWLTLEQHIECHKRLAEDGSKWDRISYLRMTRQIGHEEARVLAVSEANKSRTTQQRKEIAKKITGNKFSLGHRVSPEVRKIMSERRKQAWIIQKGKKG